MYNNRLVTSSVDGAILIQAKKRPVSLLPFPSLAGAEAHTRRRLSRQSSPWAQVNEHTHTHIHKHTYTQEGRGIGGMADGISIENSLSNSYDEAEDNGSVGSRGGDGIGERRDDEEEDDWRFDTTIQAAGGTCYAMTMIDDRCGAKCSTLYAQTTHTYTHEYINILQIFSP